MEILHENPLLGLKPVPVSDFANIAKYMTPLSRVQQIDKLLDTIIYNLSRAHSRLGHVEYNIAVKKFVKKKIIEILRSTTIANSDDLSWLTDFAPIISRSRKYPFLRDAVIYYALVSAVNVNLRRSYRLIREYDTKTDDRQIIEELHALSEHYDGLLTGPLTSNDIYPKKIIIKTTKPIILSLDNSDRSAGVDLGEFLISLQYNKNVQDFMVIAMPLQPNTRRGHPHPNISRGGGICLGVGSTAFNHAVKTGRLFDAFLIVNSILNTYGGDNPHIRLGAWQPTVVTCHDCEVRLQNSLAHKCKACWYWICTDDFAECSRCNKGRCNSCLSKVKFSTRSRTEESIICRTCISHIESRRIISQTSVQTR